jgi:outer membrane protein assembly factor BamB
MIKPLLLPALLCVVSGAAFGGDVSTSHWPHWRGPLANGLAPEADPPLKWNARRNVQWAAALPGEGSATPIIWGDQVFVLTAIETDQPRTTPPLPNPDARTTPPDRKYQYTVLCFDRNSGEKRWERIAAVAGPHEGRHGTNTYASGSPTTDGERLYVSFGSRGLFVFDMDGNPIWDRDLGEARTRRGWGEASTPVVSGDSLIVNWDTEDESFIVVTDAATGELKWRKDREEPTGWTTPLVVEHAGRKQVIVNGTNRVRSYDLATGEVLWQCGGQTTNAIPSPVADAETAYVMSGYGGSALFALPLGASGDITGTPTVRWEQHRGTPYVPSPILVDGRLYFTQGNGNVLTCLDARTGERLFGPQRIDGIANIYASPVSAAGRIYFIGRGGTSVVIKAAGKYELLAVNELDDPIDASPALVGRQLFLRSNRRLYCIEEPE